jgi:hypothetical protein
LVLVERQSHLRPEGLETMDLIPFFLRSLLPVVEVAVLILEQLELLGKTVVQAVAGLLMATVV